MATVKKLHDQDYTVLVVLYYCNL